MGARFQRRSIPNREHIAEAEVLSVLRQYRSEHSWNNVSEPRLSFTHTSSSSSILAVFACFNFRIGSPVRPSSQRESSAVTRATPSRRSRSNGRRLAGLVHFPHKTNLCGPPTLASRTSPALAPAPRREDPLGSSRDHIDDLVVRVF